MTVDSTSLRFMTEQDIRDHFSSFQHLLETCFPNFSPENKHHFINQWSISRLTSLANNQSVMGLFHIDKPLGFGVVSPPEGGVGTLFWLMIDQFCQGQGFGSRLLNYIENHFRTQDCHKIKLTAPTRNACQFYENKGFTVEGFHPNHWYQIDFWSLAKQISRT